MTEHGVDRDLQLAVRLIAAAIEPVAAARVRGAAAGGGRATRGANGDTLTARVVSHAPARTTDVVLRAWSEATLRRSPTPIVWVLRKASTERLRVLRAADENFVDVRRGLVRLHLPWLIVDRSDVPVPRRDPTARGFRNPFGDRASLVTRLLVEQPARRWGARELAEAAGVSTMTASHVIRQLADLGAIEVQRRGRAVEARLLSIRRLVEQWTRHYDWRRSASLAVRAPVGSPERFVRRLPKLLGGRRWALTLQAGASVVAPHAAWDTVHVYVAVDDAAELHTIARDAGWEPADDGQLVLVRPWYARSAWEGMRDVGGLSVVSDLQLVLDLWHYPVRGREQAETLLALMEARIDAARAGAP